MYEKHKLCAELKPKEVCVVVEQYDKGQVVRIHHIHVPKFRISQDSQIALAMCLISRFNGKTGLGFEQIVHGQLNARSKNPARYDAFQFRKSYPEPGVLRTYCGANTVVWFDEVIRPSKFRQD